MQKFAKSGVSKSSYSWICRFSHFCFGQLFGLHFTPWTSFLFFPKKVTYRATGKKCDGGNYFHFHIPDPHGLHILPQMAGWPSLPPQKYLLTLGFRNKHIGKVLERWSSRKLPIFSGMQTCLIAVTAQGGPL